MARDIDLFKKIYFLLTRDLKQFIENNFLTTARDFDLFQRMSLRYNPGLEQFVKNEFLHNGLGLRFFLENISTMIQDLNCFDKNISSPCCHASGVEFFGVNFKHGHVRLAPLI